VAANNSRAQKQMKMQKSVQSCKNILNHYADICPMQPLRWFQHFAKCFSDTMYAGTT